MSEKEFPVAKEVFLYDKDTGEFIESYQAQLCPGSNDGTYITPIYHTEKKPPITVSGEIAVFVCSGLPSEGSWLVKPDYRGTLVFNQNDNSTQIISAIGNIPQDFALTPALSFQVAQTAEQVLKNIILWRDDARYADVTTTVNKKKIAWQVDTISAGLIEGAINMVGQSVIPCPTTWRSSANDDIEVTIDDLKAIAAAAAIQTQSAYQRSWELKDEIAVAVKNNDLDAILKLSW
jgi:Domain of unknown function (DUF4376)